MKNMKNKLATDSEIETAHQSLLASELLRLITFSDLLQRYAHTKLGPSTHWVEIYALIWLIIKRGCTTHTELAKLLLRSNHKITRIVDKLENEGFVIRENSNEDRRVTNIRITEAGLATISQLIKDNYSIEEQMLGVLGDGKLEHLNQVIVSLREIITGERVEPLSSPIR
jgi:DNA-binding MarR family transcriptional regulator